MLRCLSIVLAFAGYVLPITWLRAQFPVVSTNETQCGMWILAALAIASFFAMVLSGIAAGLSGILWRRLPKPRPQLRTVELMVIGIPAIIGGALFTLLSGLFGFLFLGWIVHGIHQSWLRRNRPPQLPANG